MNDRRGRFEAQVLPYLDAAYRYARWLARSANDADDVVQEATLRAYRSFDDLRGADGKAWLLTIVRNCHLTARKQQQRRNQVPLPQDDEEQGGENHPAGEEFVGGALDPFAEEHGLEEDLKEIVVARAP